MPRMRGGRATPGQSIFWGVVILVAGVAFGAVALPVSLQAVNFVTQAQKAKGVVVRLAQQNSTLHPVIAYTTAAGQSVVITDALGINPPAHQVNDTVEVLYMPDHPELARENTFIGLWLNPALPLCFSAFFLITGLVVLADGLRRIGRKPQGGFQP